MGAFVYILLCADSSYYVGCATGEDLAPRIAQHNSGFYGGYTSARRPVTLAWSQHFEQITDAITAEGLEPSKERSAYSRRLEFRAKSCKEARRQTQKLPLALGRRQTLTHHPHPEVAERSEALEG
jgi:predicted GIY-YIG superfamily endonuclease